MEWPLTQSSGPFSVFSSQTIGASSVEFYILAIGVSLCSVHCSLEFHLLIRGARTRVKCVSSLLRVFRFWMVIRMEEILRTSKSILDLACRISDMIWRLSEELVSTRPDTWNVVMTFGVVLSILANIVLSGCLLCLSLRHYIDMTTVDASEEIADEKESPQPQEHLAEKGEGKEQADYPLVISIQDSQLFVNGDVSF